LGSLLILGLHLTQAIFLRLHQWIYSNTGTNFNTNFKGIPKTVCPIFIFKCKFPFVRTKTKGE
jgi:hypothetical protein